VVPFIWQFLGFSGYTQVAISIIASTSFSGAATRYKGFQRVTGCLFGCFMAVLFLWLSLDSLPIFCFALFIFCYVVLYVRMGHPDVNYFGIQAGVVFIIGSVEGFSPALSVTPSFERLLGIFCGIASLAIFQKFFWDISEYDDLRHAIRQMKQALHQYISSIDQKQQNTSETSKRIFQFEEKIQAMKESSCSDEALENVLEETVNTHIAVQQAIFNLSIVQKESRCRTYDQIIRLAQEVFSQTFLSFKQITFVEQKVSGLQDCIQKHMNRLNKPITSDCNIHLLLMYTHLLKCIENIQACLNAYKNNIGYGLNHGQKQMIALSELTTK